jgi:hypothetical protein
LLLLPRLSLYLRLRSLAKLALEEVAGPQEFLRSDSVKIDELSFEATVEASHHAPADAAAAADGGGRDGTASCASSPVRRWLGGRGRGGWLSVLRMSLAHVAEHTDAPPPPPPPPPPRPLIEYPGGGGGCRVTRTTLPPRLLPALPTLSLLLATLSLLLLLLLLP